MIDDSPPRGLEHLARVKAASDKRFATYLPMLIRVTTRWIGYSGRERASVRTGRVAREYIRLGVRKLVQVGRAHSRAGFFVEERFGELLALLGESHAESWPDGLTADDVKMLKNQLARFRRLGRRPIARQPVAPPPGPEPDWIYSTQAAFCRAYPCASKGGLMEQLRTAGVLSRCEPVGKRFRYIVADPRMHEKVKRAVEADQNGKRGPKRGKS